MTLGPPATYNARMFGLPSIQKLLLLAAILAAVWYGFKLIGRLSDQRKAERRLREQEATRAPSTARAAPHAGARTEVRTEEMEPCPACGAYVASRKARNCGRADCPY